MCHRQGVLRCEEARARFSGERRSLGVARGERCDRAPPGAPAGHDAGFSWLRPGGSSRDS